MADLEHHDGPTEEPDRHGEPPDLSFSPVEEVGEPVPGGFTSGSLVAALERPGSLPPGAASTGARASHPLPDPTIVKIFSAIVPICRV